jgi:hypothetical protein
MLNLLKRISIGFIAGGLIFKGLIFYLPIITGYSAWSSGRKPLEIRPLPALGGISFEIKNNIQILLNVTNLLFPDHHPRKPET